MKTSEMNQTGWDTRYLNGNKGDLLCIAWSFDNGPNSGDTALRKVGRTIDRSWIWEVAESAFEYQLGRLYASHS